jgi:nitrogen-specific signal transduction histidine kinase
MVGLEAEADLAEFRIHDFFPNWEIAELEASGGGNGGERLAVWNPRGNLRTRDGRDVPTSQAVIAHTNGTSEITCFTIIARGAFIPADAESSLQRTQIESVVLKSMSMVRASLPETVALREHFQSNNAAVLADPSQIHQMVMNLCLNSAQSMCEGGGEIFVNTARVAIKGPNAPGGNALKSGDYVRLTIRDTGPGLAPSIAPHVFEPMVAETSFAEGSSEFGLWNVKRTVVDSGGDIFVETAPDRGTAFHVYLPIVGTNGNGSSP